MEKFQTVITPKNELFDLHLGELWRYRDLVVLSCGGRLFPSTNRRFLARHGQLFSRF